MMNKKLLLSFAILIAALFLMAPAGSSLHPLPETSTSATNYQPDPTLNTNATWATFYSGWNETEYNNGTANVSLNAGLSTFYKNPISVNPSDIEAYGLLQNDKLGSDKYWNDTGIWSTSGTAGTLKTGTIGNGTTLSFTVAGNSTNGTSSTIYSSIPIADYPSNNLKYDFITGILSLSGPTVTGVNSYFYFTNSTGINGNFVNDKITPGENIYFSLPLSELPIGLNTSAGKGYSSDLIINIGLNTPAGASSSDSWTATVSGLAFTDYAIPLGTNATGAPVVNAIDPTMSTFGSPELKYTEVINNGYSVALSASPNNLTQVQTPITSGNYIEQVQYSGTFGLPSAPDLSYSASNITFPLTVPASQIQVLTLGGVSYTNALGNKTNGTVQLVSGINPTVSTSYYAIVEYTASQWNQISHPAGFFTFDGIAYYFFIAIGAIAGILGLAGAVRHAHTKAEQERKVDNMPRRGR